MSKPLTGLAGANFRLKTIVRWKPLARYLHRLAIRAPAKGKQAMGVAVGWWYSQAIVRIPVRQSRNEKQKRAGVGGARARRSGRGQFKSRTLPQVTTSGGGIRGGIYAESPYGIWLMAGTRKIAGGDVMSWSEGDPLIESWPAKDQGGGQPRAAMPIIIPWLGDARDMLVSELVRNLLK